MTFGEWVLEIGIGLVILEAHIGLLVARLAERLFGFLAGLAPAGLALTSLGYSINCRDL